MDAINSMINGSQPRDIGQDTTVSQAMAALQRDLTLPGGPQISMSGTYRFAIVPYDPRHEFEMRKASTGLQAFMKSQGWTVIPVSLQQLFLRQLHTLGDATIQQMIDREKRHYQRMPTRAFANLQQTLLQMIEPPQGLAENCSDQIRSRISDLGADPKRTLVILSHLGFLYPIFSASSLLTHLDGHTGGAAFVMLYPGQKRGTRGLSFMGRRDPDSSYRCRIY